MMLMLLRPGVLNKLKEMSGIARGFVPKENEVYIQTTNILSVISDSS